MNILIISCSLNPQSRSAMLAQCAARRVVAADVACREIDLRQCPLPLCGSPGAYDDPCVSELAGLIRDAAGILMAVPIYNFDVNAAAKNLIELTGRSWNDKVVGFLCAAGGRASYMSVMSLANSLMLDFRCMVLPRFVYASKDEFGPDGVIAKPICDRVDELADAMLRLCGALQRFDADAATPMRTAGTS
jgi:FMN reductase